MLEETGLPYEPHLVRFDTNDQLSPEFLSLNPNNKIPAILDPNGPGGRPLALFESGAILMYLAEKSGQLLSREPVQRMEVIEWLMFQMAGVGPMFGQLGWFQRNAPDNQQGLTRYTDESLRLAGVLDHRLGEAEYLAGEYSIADIANFTWVGALPFFNITLDTMPNLRRWQEAVAARPAVQRGLTVPAV
jgi:GST-like protein